MDQLADIRQHDHNPAMRNAIATVALLLVLAVGHAAGAGQEDPRLDPLFGRLQATADPREAAAIQESIWDIWMYSDKEDLNALMRQGTFALAARDFELAMESFDALIELAPRLAEAWNKRATLYYLMENYDASVADVKRTLALEPRHFGAIVGMGLIFDVLGNKEAALEAFRKGLKVNPHMLGILEKSKQIARELKERNI